MQHLLYISIFELLIIGIIIIAFAKYCNYRIIPSLFIGFLIYYGLAYLLYSKKGGCGCS